MAGEGLSIDSISFRYPPYAGDEPAFLLERLDYHLPAGRCGVVLAGSDAGKTTLARILAALVPRFTGGSLTGAARFCGRELLTARPFDLVRQVGLVFQNSEEQLITTRCDTEVAFALESLGMPRADMRARTQEALELMGLSAMRGRNPATLSGGEKKRLLLACLAAVDPELWLLDEVFEELDHAWKLIVLETLSRGGKTALFLDSRWSSLYGASCTSFAVLDGGAIHAQTPDPGAAFFTEALSRAGVSLTSGGGFQAPAGASQPARLDAAGLSFRFPGPDAFGVEVPELRLDAGSVCALLGPNGSGKSTLGRLLCGLLRPEKGEVAVQNNGKRFNRPQELMSLVGYLFQNPDSQIFLPSVRDELAFGPRAAGESEEKVSAKVEQAIRLFGLPPGDSPPALMSYGGRKKLQAATYYLLPRRFLVLDEVDSGLSYRDFLPLLQALAGGGVGILLITHDAALARAVSVRILLMEDGRIVKDVARDIFSELGGPGSGR